MDSKTIEHIALLARLDLPEDSKHSFADEFEKILSFVRRVELLPTDGVEPMVSPVDAHVKLRIDTPRSTLLQEEVAKMAPDLKEMLFSVPKVI